MVLALAVVLDVFELVWSETRSSSPSSPQGVRFEADLLILVAFAFIVPDSFFYTEALNASFISIRDASGSFKFLTTTFFRENINILKIVTQKPILQCMYEIQSVLDTLDVGVGRFVDLSGLLTTMLRASPVR